VTSAAVATSSPLLSGWLVNATAAGRTSATPDAPGPQAIYRAVGGDYFKTVGTRIVRGRALGPSDGPGAPEVVVINEQLAKALFPGEDPLGKAIDIAGVRAPIRAGRVTVVGVAADIKEVGLHEVAFSDLYVAYAQRPSDRLELLVRGTGDDATMFGALRSALAATDPLIPMTSPSPLRQRVDEARRGERFNLILISTFAIAAVAIAAIGLYAALAYAATARRREFAVRLALGATPADLLRQALWQAVRIGAVGGAAGVAAALAAAAALGDALYLVPGQHNGLLFDVSTTDPLSLAGAAAGAVLLALAAGASPARRVARIDPARVLGAD
jgi:ABC-type antimicrobial peptide transport system permease subunit